MVEILKDILMKRSTPSMRQVRFGVFELDLEAGVLRRNGRKVKLQEQPFQVLAMLLERPGQVVTREELQQRLWSTDTFVDFDHGLNKAINKIRLALGDSADAPRFVETLARRGYRFIASLHLPAKSPIRSIAVLPLQNVSGDAAQEYFSDGLTDALITNLAKIGALKVISRTSVMQYKATQKSIPIIASELGVDAVLEGTVYREGNRVRTTAQLIEVATDSHLWAENYERDLTSVLALQSQIAREVAREVHVHLTPQEASRLGDAAIVNTEAYEAYLRGRSHLHKFTPDGIQAANTYFQTALELDAGSALANSALAEVFFFSMLNALVSPSEAGPRGLAAAERAVELDPNLAQGYVSLALFRQYYEWNWSAAESAYLRALDLSPNSADAHIYHALLLTCLGRSSEAARHMQRGLELDPLNLLYQHIAGVQLLWIGKHDQAIAQLRSVVARAANMQMTHLTLWAALNSLGRLDEALSAAITAWSVVNDEEMIHALEQGNTKDGYRGAMRQGAETLVARSERTYVLPHIVSLLFDAAGDPDRVFQWIERGYLEREHAMSYFNRKPFSRHVQADPRFQDMLQRLNLPR